MKFDTPSGNSEIINTLSNKVTELAKKIKSLKLEGKVNKAKYDKIMKGEFLKKYGIGNDLVDVYNNLKLANISLNSINSSLNREVNKVLNSTRLSYKIKENTFKSKEEALNFLLDAKKELKNMADENGLATFGVGLLSSYIMTPLKVGEEIIYNPVSAIAISYAVIHVINQSFVWKSPTSEKLTRKDFKDIKTKLKSFIKIIESLQLNDIDVKEIDELIKKVDELSKKDITDKERKTILEEIKNDGVEKIEKSFMERMKKKGKKDITTYGIKKIINPLGYFTNNPNHKVLSGLISGFFTAPNNLVENVINSSTGGNKGKPLNQILDEKLLEIAPDDKMSDVDKIIKEGGRKLDDFLKDMAFKKEFLDGIVEFSEDVEGLKEISYYKISDLVNNDLIKLVEEKVKLTDEYERIKTINENAKKVKSNLETKETNAKTSLDAKQTEIDTNVNSTKEPTKTFEIIEKIVKGIKDGKGDYIKRIIRR